MYICGPSVDWQSVRLLTGAIELSSSVEITDNKETEIDQE